MLNFNNLDGTKIKFGKDDYNIDDEKAFVIALDKMMRVMDHNNPDHVQALKSNVNIMSEILNFNPMPEGNTIDEVTFDNLKYLRENMPVFKKYGITEHINAKKLEKITHPAFTENEYPPNIEEMKNWRLTLPNSINKTKNHK